MAQTIDGTEKMIDGVLHVWDCGRWMPIEEWSAWYAEQLAITEDIESEANHYLNHIDDEQNVPRLPY